MLLAFISIGMQLLLAQPAAVRAFGMSPKHLAAPPAHSEFRTTTSGQCAKMITTLADCSKAASALKLSDTTAQRDHNGVALLPYDPTGCYLEAVRALQRFSPSLTHVCTRTPSALLLQ